MAGLTRTISGDGAIDFDNLDLGLYLLVQNQAAEGYLKAAPFLVSMPMMEDGTYIYDVIANTKIELEKLPETPPETKETESSESEPSETETEKNKIPGNPAPPRLPPDGAVKLADTDHGCGRSYIVFERMASLPGRQSGRA